MDRARERLAEASAGRPRDADVSAMLERTHFQLVELSTAADGLGSTLPAQVGEAVREGVRREAAPVGRQLAEVRGMAVQLLRRLERLENDLTAERHARIDDLGLLVDLIGAGWQSVDERLERIEQALGSAPPRSTGSANAAPRARRDIAAATDMAGAAHDGSLGERRPPSESRETFGR